MVGSRKPYSSPRLHVLGKLRAKTGSNSGTKAGDAGTMMA